MEYEICYLIGESKESDWEKIKKDVEAVITKEKGSLLDDDYREKRRMSYEINKEARGTYLAKRFVLPGVDDDNFKAEAVVNITNELNLSKNLLRFIIVKADELPKKLASKQMQEENENDKNSDIVKKTEQKESEKEVKKIVKEEVKRDEGNLKIENDDMTEKTEKVKEKKKSTDEDSDKKEVKKDDKNLSEDEIDEKLDEILNI